jgi:hypothetical protein
MHLLTSSAPESERIFRVDGRAICKGLTFNAAATQQRPRLTSKKRRLPSHGASHFADGLRIDAVAFR